MLHQEEALAKDKVTREKLFSIFQVDTILGIMNAMYSISVWTDTWLFTSS